ncbi:hypothetical protein [Corynebacterium argentoratense]|uniref:hypothetical protein n=1 Tax=Corynebacterium argentoratense TaxID=42817 RepID=UPI0028E63C34|nr:hypothetical protein [Corynebacterium argentoratense]
MHPTQETINNTKRLLLAELRYITQAIDNHDLTKLEAITKQTKEHGKGGLIATYATELNQQAITIYTGKAATK